MKQLDFSTGVQEYTLNGRVNVSFNPTDVVFLERLTQTRNALEENRNAMTEFLK